MVFQGWSQQGVKMFVTQLCPTLYAPMDCSPHVFSIQGILQATILDWVAIPFYRGSSQPRDWTWISCIAGRFFTVWAIRDPKAKTHRWNSKKKTRQSCACRPWQGLSPVPRGEETKIAPQGLLRVPLTRPCVKIHRGNTHNCHWEPPRPQSLATNVSGSSWSL